MSVIFVMLPIALLLGGAAVLAFAIAARRGQFDDLDTPPLRMIVDQDSPAADTKKQSGAPRSQGPGRGSTSDSADHLRRRM